VNNTISAAVLSAVTATAWGQLSVTPSVVVVKTGDVIPDATGALFEIDSLIGTPFVNATGWVIVLGSALPVDHSAESKRVAITNRTGQPVIVARQGEVISPASAYPAEVWGNFAGSVPFIADDGRIVLSAPGSPAFPLGTSGRNGIMTSRVNGEWAITTVSGAPVPGNPGLTYDIPSTQMPARVDDGRLAFAARTADPYYVIVEHGNDLLIDDQLPMGQLMGVVNRMTVASSGDFVYAARYSGFNGEMLRGRLAGDGPRTICIQGQVFPIVNLPGSWAVHVDASNFLSINAIGEVLVSCALRDALTPGAADKTALVKFTPGGLVLLARQGDPVPGLPGATWTDPDIGLFVLSDTGESACRLTIQGSGVTPLNDTVLVLFGAGGDPSVTRLVRESAPVPDMPGFTYSDGFSFSMSRDGRVFYVNAIKGPDGVFRSASIAVDRSGMSRTALVTDRSMINIPSIGSVLVSAHSGMPRTGGNDGQHRTVTEDGRFATLVTYSAGQAVVLLDPPCPADLGAPGGGAGQDGVLDNNDFVVFIDYFFNADARADRGAVGGVAQPDGVFDNNDFVVFIDQFFAGCD
jgi:hypothetical protein